MLFLKTIAGIADRNIKRRLSGISFNVKWQNVYRELDVVALGRHVADETLLGADEAWGLSINIVGFHLFIGFLLEAI